MKLLYITQAIDLDDPVLSVYHNWLVEIAQHFESVEAICLKEGRHSLPAHIRVHSLGKEKGRQSAVTYAMRFLNLAWRLRGDYDSVFVHMNQEYILIAGWLWKLLAKPVYLWRNHHTGSWLTDIAAALATTIFCTSTHSYTARYKKTVLMPVGVDTQRFTAQVDGGREPNSILFLSRMAPSKRPELLIDALHALTQKGVAYQADFYGSPLPVDETYYASLKERVNASGLHTSVRFYPGVTNEEARAIYASHQLYVNTSPSGMFDKTMFEAAASGCIVLAISDDWAKLAGETFACMSETLAAKLEMALALSTSELTAYRAHLREVAEKQSLTTLAESLATHIHNDSRTAGRILRYLISGGLATLTNLVTTAVLAAYTTLHYLVVVSIAVAISIVVSFTLQKLFTFRNFEHTQTVSQFIGFVIVALINLGVNDLIVYLLVHVTTTHWLVLDQAIASVVIACYSFFLYRYGIFRS